MTARFLQDTTHLRTDAARITELVAVDVDAPVPACPDWSLRDLVGHLGAVHRWAREAVLTGGPPDRDRGDSAADAPPEAPDALARWFGDGAIRLAATLDEADPAGPTWMPFAPEGPVVGMWTRRQTQETSLHRWDAESSVAVPQPIDAALASDGIDEYFELILPRLLDRRGTDRPTSSLHVHCTDTEGEWTVEVVDGGYRLDRAHRKGDAVLRGPAQDLLLRLWGRSVPDGSVEVMGDGSAAAAWVAIGGP